MPLTDRGFRMFRPLLLAFLLSVSPALACTLPNDVDAMRDEAIQAINAERKAAGLAPVRENAALTRAAQGHACDSAGRDKMSHVGSDGSKLATRIKREGYRFSIAAENVGYGFRSPRSAVAWWMTSPPHRKNILTRGMRDVGIGVAYSAGNKPHWVMDTAASK